MPLEMRQALKRQGQKEAVRLNDALTELADAARDLAHMDAAANDSIGKMWGSHGKDADRGEETTDKTRLALAEQARQGLRTIDHQLRPEEQGSRQEQKYGGEQLKHDHGQILG